MQVSITQPESTKAVLQVTADKDELASVRNAVLVKLGKDVKIPGFRPGKAPTEVLEKHIDPQLMQQEFLESLVQDLYPKAVTQQNIRPVDHPEISIKTFVPFSDVTFEATIPVISEVKLPDYKKIKLARPKIDIKPAEIDEVIESLRTQSADKQTVERAAKESDQITIDFKGTDTNGKSIPGADGKDYPLVIGSKSFIPGFEENLVGLKAGADKQFEVTFPKDYGVSSLAGEKVTFQVTVKQVQAIKKPKVDDAFAQSVGPVKTVAELRRDIEKELSVEKQRQADTQYESDLLQKITQKSSLEVPQVLVEQQVQRMLDELKQNLSYRGQTIKEFLASKGLDEDAYRQQELTPQAEERVKASIVLSEIAEKEQLAVTPEELEVRLQVLKGQYKDQQMQAELDKPEARQNIASRMLSEKTMAQLAAYAQK